MSGHPWRRLGLLAFVLAAAAIWFITQFRVTTDITRFIPDAEDRRLAAISRAVVDSELSRTMILALEAETTDAAIDASRTFEALLRDDPRIRASLGFLEGGPADGIAEATWRLFAPRRLAYLAATPEAARDRLSDEGLTQAATDLRARLASPLSSLVARLAPEDPLLVLPTLLDRARFARSSEIAVVEDRFLARDQRTAILFLGTKTSALDPAAQRPVLDAIEEAFETVRGNGGRPLVLRQSGVNRYAVRTAETIEADIRRVSIVSSIALIAGLLALFRSLRILFFAAVPITTGLLLGAAAVLATRASIHGITLAFGAALISVTVDYAAHLYCHHVLARPDSGARTSTRALFRPLATGCATTLAGFLALASSSLEGLREIGLFGLVGVAGAFVATFIVAPVILPNETGRADRNRWTRTLADGFAMLRRQRRAAAILPLLVLVVVAAGLPRLSWQPDVTQLGALDGDIRAEDEAVRSKVSRFEQMRMVIASAEGEEEALERNEAVARALATSRSAGEITDYRNLMPFLPSASTQRAVAAVATEDDRLADRWRAAFQQAGFRTDLFAPFVASLESAPPPPLDFETLLASPLGSLVRSFRIHLDDRVAFVSLLGTVHDRDALAARIDDLPGATLIEQASLMNETQTTYQQSTRRVLSLAALVVLGILTLRYRDARRVGAAIVPPLLAVAATLATLALLGRGVDLIVLTALVLVVSMGVDYSVLLIDAVDARDDRAIAAALTGALIASGTTSLAFGLLARSAHPVLSNLGWTAMIGVLTSFVLAPVTLVLLERAGTGPERAKETITE